MGFAMGDQNACSLHFNPVGYPALNAGTVKNSGQLFRGVKGLPNLKRTVRPLKIGHPKRKLIFQASIFRGNLLVSGSVTTSEWGWPTS